MSREQSDKGNSWKHTGKSRTHYEDLQDATLKQL